MTAAARLALGTVQFGLDYGITNAAGRVPEAEVAAILDLASEGGIDLLDTATAYGEAEAVLGRLAAPSFRIVTKIGGPPEGFAEAARASAARLGRAPHAVLLHNARALLGPDGEAVARALLALKERGLAGRIGLSVYSPEVLAAAVARLRPDLVQLPLNVLDRRFERSGWIARLREAGVEVHARSLFLQGALLAPATPPRLAFAHGPLSAFRRACAAAGLSPLAACLAAGLAAPVDRLVLGVTSRAELAEALAVAASPATLPSAFAALATEDETLVDPSRWPPG